MDLVEEHHKGKVTFSYHIRRYMIVKRLITDLVNLDYLFKVVSPLQSSSLFVLY